MRGRMLVGTVMMGALALVPIGGSQAATKPERGYVTNALTLPTNNTQALAFGRDVDGDGDKENQLGQVFAVLASQGLDLTGLMDGALTNGDIVMLHSLRTFSLANTKNATWQVWYGAPTAEPPLFDGTDTFALLAGQPHSGKLAATIKDHHVKTVAGNVPVRLDIGAGPFVLDMTKAKVFATCFKSGCSGGRINGGVHIEEIEAKFYPEMVEFTQAMVDADCPGPGPDSCEPDSSGATVQNLFDENNDLIISPAEISENSLIQTLFRPDLNLVSGDGVPFDSISFGFGFTTAKAKLTRP